MAIVEDLAVLSRRERLRLAALVIALFAAVLWITTQLLHPGAPHRIVLASGNANGVYHAYAQRYVQLLAREGINVQERMTEGASENLQLLLDPKSGVDVAFLQGGLAKSPQTDDLVMFASLYYEPLWIFYRAKETLTDLRSLHGKRIAVGVPGSGTRALALQMLEQNGVVDANGIGRDNTDIVPASGPVAVRALRAGEIDAVLFVGGADTPAIQQALRDPVIKLMSLARADAYPRRFPFITKLTLPAGTIDFALGIPDRDVDMIGTKAMLVGRDGLHPALINLLLDAAREIHGEQGYFEAAGEFPGIARVDLRVSSDADQHKRFGPSALYRYLPYSVAAFLERAIIVLVPLLVVLVPLVNILPQFLRWRARSRIYRWYGELALLERDVDTRKGSLPIEGWMRDLDRIEHSVERIHTPASFAAEAYTLREHINLVRRAITTKAESAQPTAEGAAP
jgi:TRAP transporter TAXI family solute receptor